MTGLSKLRSLTLLGPLLVLSSVPATAQDRGSYRTPELVERLYACQALPDDAQRLTCFEQAVAAIKAAEEQRDISFADREQVKEARRGLFGLGNIRLGLFSRGDDGPDEDQIEEIEANVAGITKQRDGKLLIRLEDGALWAQTGYEKVRISEMKAKTVRIKRGSLGSYTARLGDGGYLKVKRIN